jgi:hypothetical protein
MYSLAHRRLLDTHGIQLDVDGKSVTAAINLTNRIEPLSMYQHLFECSGFSHYVDPSIINLTGIYAFPESV